MASAGVEPESNRKTSREFLLVGFRSFDSVLVGGRRDRTSAAAWSPRGRAHVPLPGDGGSDLRLQREKDHGRDRAVEEIVRFQANQTEDLVCADRPPDARHHASVIRANALIGSAPSGPAVYDFGGTGAVSCVLRIRAG